MKKWLIVGGVLIVVVIVAVLFGLSKIGPMIKAAVNTYGPDITRTEVRLGDVSVSLFSAEARLSDFLLGNPQGFKTPQAMRVGSIFVNVDEKSLTGDTIVIDRVEIVRPEITFEKASGTDNFQTIMDNVKAAAGAGSGAKQSAQQDAGGGKKLLIRDLLIREGKISLAMTALGDRTVSVNLPAIHLKDLGKRSGGATPAETFTEVFAALHAKITGPAVTEAFTKGLKDLGVGAEALGKEAAKIAGSVGQEAGKAAESVGGKVTETLKGMFGK